jgi:peptidoglycan hydrolase-like protein with peptidoglycan-binding domain
MGLFALIGMVSAGYAETPKAAAKKKVSSTSKARRPAAKASAAPQTVAANRSSSAGSAAKKSTKPTKNATSAYRRSSQATPTVERYQEIQQALAERGYFEGSPDGRWGASSTEALKRFQREQNLVEDGKLGSLSLIALGLGPRRGAPADSSVRSTQPPPPPQQ